MYRQNRRDQNDSKTRKSSFGASSQTLCQDRRAVKTAIDMQLSSVQFNAQDMRTVLQRTRKKKTLVRRRRFKPDLAFAFALVMMLSLPLSLYAMKSRNSITTIITSPGEITPSPILTSQQQGFPVPSAVVTAAPTAPPAAASKEQTDGLLTEADAVRIARECFETHCDTTIFTFEEYHVSAVLSTQDVAKYTVTMNSIYQNGCSFCVILSADSGEILQYSTPKLATTPGYVDSTHPEIRAWFDKYGEQMITWPQDAQAEFSRRYQGGTLRSAKEDEITYEEAIAAVRAPIDSKTPGQYQAFYPVLYSEHVSNTGRAYYLVYCYPQEISDTLPNVEPLIISFDAQTGDILNITGSPLDE